MCLEKEINKNTILLTYIASIEVHMACSRSIEESEAAAGLSFYLCIVILFNPFFKGCKTLVRLIWLR